MSIETGTRKVGNCFLYMAAVLHLRPDLVLVQADDCRESQVYTGAVRGTDYFFCLTRIFRDGLYLPVPVEVWFEFKSVSAFKAEGLPERRHLSFIAILVVLLPTYWVINVKNVENKIKQLVLEG